MRQVWIALAHASVVAAVCLAAPSAAQDRLGLNTISKVEVKGNAVEITGTRRPYFTTFTLTDPPRLVIDLTGAVFAGVAPSLAGAPGSVITGVKTASYNNDANAIARIVIGFDHELEADITSNEAQLIIKLPPNPKDAQRPTLEKRAAEKAEAERLAQEKAEREAKARAAREEQERKAKEAQEARLKAEAEKREQERLAREDLERRAKEAQEARLKAEAEKKDKERLAREETERKRREAEEARLKAEAEKKEQERLVREEAARKKREAEEARLQAEAEKKEQERLVREEAAAKKREAEEARLQAEAEKKERERLAREEAAAKKREAEEARLQAEAEKKEQERLARAERERQQREAAEARQKAEEERRRAARVAVAPDPKAEEQRRAEQERKRKELEVAAINTPPPGEIPGRARMTFVGFHQQEGVGRIFLRTTAPVRYSMGEDQDRNVVVTLENTEIGLPASQRMLDTSFFDTAVSLVRPENSEDKVRVTISLKRAVAYRATQAGNELTVEFAAPE